MILIESDNKYWLVPMSTNSFSSVSSYFYFQHSLSKRILTVNELIYDPLQLDNVVTAMIDTGADNQQWTAEIAPLPKQVCNNYHKTIYGSKDMAARDILFRIRQEQINAKVKRRAP